MRTLTNKEILILVVQVTTRICRRSIFFPTSRLTQEKEKFEYRRATYKIRHRVFCPTSRSRQESEGFFTNELHTRAGSTRSQGSRESARAGLSQKRKEKRKTKEGGLSPQEGDVEKRKEKRKTKEGGLSPQEGDVRKKRKEKRPRKARRWLPRRQGSVCP
jgi:hypothetical protein